MWYKLDKGVIGNFELDKCIYVQKVERRVGGKKWGKAQETEIKYVIVYDFMNKQFRFWCDSFAEAEAQVDTLMIKMNGKK